MRSIILAPSHQELCQNKIENQIQVDFLGFEIFCLFFGFFVVYINLIWIFYEVSDIF
jgi:hypothetical protein